MSLWANLPHFVDSVHLFLGLGVRSKTGVVRTVQ